MQEANRDLGLASLARIRPLRSELLQFLGGKCGENGRQFDTEERAAFLPVIAKNLSVMFLDDSETDAQAETGALADRLGRIKGIKDTMRLLNARAGVGKQNDHVAAIAHGLDHQDAAFV